MSARAPHGEMFCCGAADSLRTARGHVSPCREQKVRRTKGQFSALAESPIVPSELNRAM